MKNDLEKMGKTMPYTIPDGFFDAMEERLMKEVATKEKKPILRKVVLWASIVVAASFALLLVFRQGKTPTKEKSFEQMEMAFNQLCDDDQQLMLDYYEELDDLDNY